MRINLTNKLWMSVFWFEWYDQHRLRPRLNLHVGRVWVQLRLAWRWLPYLCNCYFAWGPLYVEYSRAASARAGEAKANG